MRLRHLPIMLAAFAVAFTPSTGSACTLQLRHYSAQDVRRMAEQAVASATTIVDGEIISPMTMGDDFLTVRPDLRDGLLPVAFIKVSHVWKGQVEDGMAPVAYLTSCDIGLETKGQKIRILLSGAGIFTAGQFINGWQAGDKKDEFNGEVDRILGSARPADFTEPGVPELTDH